MVKIVTKPSFPANFPFPEALKSGVDEGQARVGGRTLSFYLREEG
jgi:hypothetical protein